MKNEEMSLVEHLGELRKRIMWILVVLVLGMVGGLIAAKPVIRYLKSIPPAEISVGMCSLRGMHCGCT